MGKDTHLYKKRRILLFLFKLSICQRTLFIFCIAFGGFLNHQRQIRVIFSATVIPLFNIVTVIIYFVCNIYPQLGDQREYSG